MEAIVEKLCQKLKHNVSSHKEIEWRNTAFCLTQIKYNEKIFTKLLEHYESWKERMIDSPDVHEMFNVILQNVRKVVNKDKIEEFEAKINSDENQEKKVLS